MDPVDEDTLKGLSSAERTTLCKVLGVNASGLVAAVCDRIVEKVAPALLSSHFLDDLQVTDNASFWKIAGINRAALLAALGGIPGGAPINEPHCVGCRNRSLPDVGCSSTVVKAAILTTCLKARGHLGALIDLPRQWGQDSRREAWGTRRFCAELACGRG